MRHGVAAKNIKRGGFAVSTGLVAAGTDKLLPENVKKHTGARAAIDGTAGVSTALLMRAAYYKTIRMGKTMAGKPGLRTLDALKLAAKRVFSRGTKF